MSIKKNEFKMMRLTFGAPHGKDHLVLDIEDDGGHNDRRQHRLQQRQRSCQVNNKKTVQHRIRM